MKIDPTAAVTEIDGVLAEWKSFRALSRYDDCSDQPASEIARLSSLLAACVERMAPLGSSYRITVAASMKKFGVTSFSIAPLKGALEALRADFAAGRHRNFEELIHADLFADFLDAAEHLLSEGWKDPAAVIAGGVLEEHLRKMATKAGLPIQLNGKPKMAEGLNMDLVAAKAYSKLDQKNVTAWLDLRNKAAHGKYTEYTKEQVGLNIDNIRNFLARHPA